VGQERLGPSYFFIPLVLGPINSLVWYVPSLRYTRGLGWRIHSGVEVTELSTNKQYHLSEKDPLPQGWFWRNPWGKRRMGSLVKQCFPYDTCLLLLPLFQICCQVPPRRARCTILMSPHTNRSRGCSHCVTLGGRNMRMIPHCSTNFLSSSVLCIDALSHTSSIRLGG